MAIFTRTINTQDSRMIQKLSTVTGQVPTVAPSDNHVDGTWDSLDIYVGELFMNAADGKMWCRTNNGIKEIFVVPSNAATGDVFYISGSTIQKLAIGTSGQVLAVSSGNVPEWQEPTIYKKTIRVTPAEFAALNSSSITAVAGISGKACLFISGSAIPYTGSTPYNEGSNLGVLDTVNLIQQGQTVNITNTGRSAIITQQQTSDCLSDGNGLLLFMGNDLTGGDIGYDVTLFYSFIDI